MSQHSVFSPSASHRWLSCAGSVKLSAKCPNPSSPAAMEGTDAHGLAELCFSSGKPAADFIGEKGQSGLCFSKSMAKHVQTYVDYVNEYKAQTNGTLLVEKRVSIASVDERIYGTSDVILLSESPASLDVFDLKYGKWAVEVETSTQLMIYALGAIESLNVDLAKLRHVTAHICQPRSKHKDGPNRSTKFSVESLMHLKSQIATTVKLADEENPPLYSGEHCRFCPAELICPELNSLGRAIQI